MLSDLSFTQAIPYCWMLFVVPMHLLTHELLLFATGIWTANIHDNIDGRSAARGSLLPALQASRALKFPTVRSISVSSRECGCIAYSMFLWTTKQLVSVEYRRHMRGSKHCDMISYISGEASFASVSKYCLFTRLVADPSG